MHFFPLFLTKAMYDIKKSNRNMMKEILLIALLCLAPHGSIHAEDEESTEDSEGGNAEEIGGDFDFSGSEFDNRKEETGEGTILKTDSVKEKDAQSGSVAAG